MTEKQFISLLNSGEGQKIEFKENVNADLSKEMVAFANASGGTILIGVSDQGVVKPLVMNNTLKTQIQQHANDCDRPIIIEIENIDGRSEVLAVLIPESEIKPHRNSKGFYLRQGPISQKLRTDQIEAIFQRQGRVRFDSLVRRESNYNRDLDGGATKRFYDISNIDSPNSFDALVNIGAMEFDGKDLFLTNAGVLFFAQKPDRFVRNAVVDCVLYRHLDGVEVLDRKILDGNMMANIDDAMLFLSKHLDLRYVINGSRREEIWEIPEVALREAVVNAVAHRDYFETGASVMIQVYPDRVEISNPGGLPAGLSVERFGFNRISRNPVVTDLLYRANYVEKLGSGVKRIRSLVKQAQLPDPKFIFDDSFFTVVFSRSTAIGLLRTQYKFTDDQSRRMYMLLKSLVDYAAVSLEEMAEQMEVTSRTLRKDLDRLEAVGLLQSSGKTQGKKYGFTDAGREIMKK